MYTLWGGIAEMSAWQSPDVAFDPKYPTRRALPVPMDKA